MESININYDSFIKIALKAINRSVNEIFNLDDETPLSSKNEGAGGDISTKADLISEKILVDEFISNGYSGAILTEEKGFFHNLDSNLLLIIDPLDGSKNFERGFPFVSISIALWENNQPIIGIIHDIFNNSTYLGIKSGGSWIVRNNMKSPLKVSNTQNTKDYFCTLIRPTCENEYLKLSKLFFYVKTTRVVVSAALELAYVASGKTDCFVDIVFNKNLNKGGVRLVDVAAGILIVKESGGTIWSDNLNYLIENKNNLKLQTNLIAINDIRNLDELLALYSFE